MKIYLVNHTPAGTTYSDTHSIRGIEAAMDKAKALAGAGEEFVKKGVGPGGYIGANGAAYVIES